MSLLDHVFYKDPYGTEYELSFSAWGEGILKEDGLLEMQKPDNVIGKFKSRFRRYPKSISLALEDSVARYGFGYTGIDPALLEKLETLKELVLPDSVVQIETTPKLEKIFKKNDTLIRGNFDSYAERFAAAHGLHFRPADLIIAEYCFEQTRENARLTLEFKRSGRAQIDEKFTASGAPAGIPGGYGVIHELKKDFWEKETAGEIAASFRACLNDAILKDGRLAAFLEKAKTHDFYKGKN